MECPSSVATAVTMTNGRRRAPPAGATRISSVMPTVPRANTHATVPAIAERGSLIGR